MPTAIQLTRKNIDAISEATGLQKRTIVHTWQDSVMATPEPEPVYYVFDVQYMGTRLPFLIYTEREFLDDFATVPDGIQDRLVKVTQVKAGP